MTKHKPAAEISSGHHVAKAQHAYKQPIEPITFELTTSIGEVYMNAGDLEITAYGETLHYTAAIAILLVGFIAYTGYRFGKSAKR